MIALCFNTCWNVIYSCDDKAVLSVPLLQSSESHDPSEIIIIYWFTAQQTCIIIINVENSSPV